MRSTLATTPTRLPASGSTVLRGTLGGIGLAIVVVVAVAVVLAGSLVRTQPTGVPGAAADRTATAGYPAHYGLAGPSRLGQAGQSWRGYPPHYGLAGSSQVDGGG